MQEIDLASSRVGEDARLFDRQSFRERWAGGRIFRQAAHARVGLGALDEDAQELRLLAVERQRYAPRPLEVDRGDLLHDLEQVAEVVLFGHRVSLGVAAV